MKHAIGTTLITMALFGFSAQTMAASGHEGHGDHKAAAPAASASAPLAEGLVKKIDKAAGKVTISHGALPNGMPAMTMAFRVKDAAWIGKMKVGQKIRFAADEVDGAMTVTRFEAGQ